MTLRGSNQNNGEHKKYIQEDHHPAIISREMFRAVSGLREGLKRYAIPGIVAGVLSFVAFLLVYFPLIIDQPYGKY